MLAIHPLVKKEEFKNLVLYKTRNGTQLVFFFISKYNQKVIRKKVRISQQQGNVVFRTRIASRYLCSKFFSSFFLISVIFIIRLKLLLFFNQSCDKKI